MLVFILFLVFNNIASSRSAKINLSSQLFDALEIDELSTSSFIYNGVAEIYDESGEKLLYSALYHATVKAGIQMQDIDFVVDTKGKTVQVVLPEITIQNVSVDPSYIDFLPDKSKIDLPTVLTTCREDVQREAMESGKLISTAEENLKNVIEALTLPLIEGQGYTLEW